MIVKRKSWICFFFETIYTSFLSNRMLFCDSKFSFNCSPSDFHATCLIWYCLLASSWIGPHPFLISAVSVLVQWWIPLSGLYDLSTSTVCSTHHFLSFDQQFPKIPTKFRLLGIYIRVRNGKKVFNIVNIAFTFKRCTTQKDRIY